MKNQMKKVLDGTLEYEAYIGAISNECGKLNSIHETFSYVLKDTKLSITDQMVYGGISYLEGTIRSFISKEPRHYQEHLTNYYSHLTAEIKLPALILHKTNIKAELQDMKQYIDFKDGVFSVNVKSIDVNNFHLYIDEDLYNDFAEYVKYHNRLADRYKKYTADILMRLSASYHEPGSADFNKLIDKLGSVLKHYNQ